MPEVQLEAKPQRTSIVEVQAAGLATRRARADTLRRLKARELSIVDVLREVPPELGNVWIFEVLCRLPHVRDRTILHLNARAIRAHINLAVRMQHLTPRARAWLINEFEEGHVYGYGEYARGWRRDSPHEPAASALA